MTNTLLQTALLRSQAKKKSKKNGFTLIELMVVVAIVGVLSAVGLPQLLKAQDKAKDSAAKAEVVNAAKTCSIDVLTGSSGFVAADFPLVTGTCGADQDLVGTSTGSDGTTYTVSLDAGGIPGLPVEG
jgi:prepilin-type N-terminal cleavage/methylation domain-containing protein